MVTHIHKKKWNQMCKNQMTHCIFPRIQLDFSFRSAWYLASKIHNRIDEKIQKILFAWNRLLPLRISSYRRQTFFLLLFTIGIRNALQCKWWLWYAYARRHTYSMWFNFWLNHRHCIQFILCVRVRLCEFVIYGIHK